MTANKNIEMEIKQIISDSLNELNRPDLFRQPIVAFSSASDERYWQLKDIIGDWHLSPTELLPEAKSVISYFVPFTREVAMEPKTSENGSFLWSESYQEINQHFDLINQAVEDFLTRHGYLTKTIQATHTYDPKDLKSMWSHRSAAAIAGLGTFGLNRMLITEKGSAGRFCTIITSATLTANSIPIENKCLYEKNGSCKLCLKICPVKALSIDSFEKFDCQDEVNKNEIIMKETTNLQFVDTCGKCISICPVAYIE
jgi:epoxyqueuosine reductase QueG